MNYALSDHRQIRLRITSDVISKILNLNKLEEDLYCRKQVLKSMSLSGCLYGGYQAY
ncbi:MAG: hypothetical protein WAQ92_02440 [Leptotrichiaceae bacterium]